MWWLRSVAVACTLLLGTAALVWTAPLWVIDHGVRVHLWTEGVASRYVTIDGERIHYLEARPGPSAAGERSLVLIHGLGAKAEDWSPMLPALARAGFHVYALDLLGYGRSAKPVDASFSIRQETAVVNAFMQALEIERADVGGWSMGGWVAMQLALDRPERVNRLVLFDAAGIYFRVDSPETLFAPADRTQFRELAARLTTRNVPGFLVDDGLRRYRRNGWVIHRSVAAMTNGADLLDFRLGGLRKPTLILWGGQDHLIPVSVGQELHRAIADSELKVLPDCGHLLPVECSRDAVSTTVSFLQGSSPEPAGGSRQRVGLHSRAIAAAGAGS